ncbi:pyridoxamine 5'-phosphate oxidase family protein [Sphingomonas sabuli]|uniref:Pyridoxamine 5'-phosphate oxidase family protein n=1 Tax=Sphingomonas sabuli TaxID=2764186 RepID=A0A7G9L430_9SPHN|nr:pyridoxamine 5'-phosphate oxidase family protein [Sphingomonas sabuli]QNM83379.1 pyridoxamine 5'-phosphate oxidase family protein [Sphingomonas sabuli]
MGNEQELKSDFWDALDDSPFMMLGLKGSGMTRPMTAQVDDQKDIYFFASKSEELVKDLGTSGDAIAAYASKGHDFFASVKGRLEVSNDRAKIDELWNPMVATWYKDGKEDPDLVLLRLADPTADVWKSDGTSLLKTVWLKLTGGDPGEQLDNDNRAEVAL